MVTKLTSYLVWFQDSSSLYAADIDIVKENLHKNHSSNTIICSQLKISSKKTKSENGTHNGYSEAKPVSQKEKADIKINNQSTKLANQGNTTQKKNAKLVSKSAPPLSFFGKKASGVFCLRCVYCHVFTARNSLGKALFHYGVFEIPLNWIQFWVLQETCVLWRNNSLRYENVSTLFTFLKTSAFLVWMLPLTAKVQWK